ncbi:hypothetical protein FQZ97_753330 [compost metagenome]
MHLPFQGVPDVGVGAGEGHLGLVLGHVHPDLETPEFLRIELDLGGFQVLARQPHHPVHHCLAPATLLHGHRLAGHQGRRALGLARLLADGLAQGVEAAGEQFVARLRLVLAEAFRQFGGKFAHRQLDIQLALPGFQRLVGEGGQGTGEVLHGAGRGLHRLGRVLRLLGGLGTLLQGHFHRRHAIELVKVRVKARFRQGGRCGTGHRRRHGQRFQAGFGIGRQGIGGQLAGHGHQQHRVHRRLLRDLGRLDVLGRQGLAAIGNGRLAGGRVGRRLVRACGLIRLGLDLFGRGFVALGRLGLALLRVHLGEAGRLALAGFRRFFRGFCGRCFRLHFRPGLKKQIGGNGHGHSPLGLVRAGGTARDGPISRPDGWKGLLAGQALPLVLQQVADQAEFLLDLMDEDGGVGQLFAPGEILQLLAQAGQHWRAHVAAAALEAVRSQAQGLAIGLGIGLHDLPQAFCRVHHEGIQQHRKLVFHDVPQGRQHGMVEMDIRQIRHSLY